MYSLFTMVFTIITLNNILYVFFYYDATTNSITPFRIIFLLSFLADPLPFFIP